MKYQNDAHEAAYTRVHGLMQELFGEDAWADPDNPNFMLQRGSSEVNVTVAPLEDNAVVSVFAWVVTGATPTEELYKYLLTENSGFIFGGFALDDKNNVIYQHTIVGETVDKQQLRTSIRAVTKVADDYDDTIAERFGGKTAKDAGTPS